MCYSHHKVKRSLTRFEGGDGYGSSGPQVCVRETGWNREETPVYLLLFSPPAAQALGEAGGSGWRVKAPLHVLTGWPPLLHIDDQQLHVRCKHCWYRRSLVSCSPRAVRGGTAITNVSARHRPARAGLPLTCRPWLTFLWSLPLRDFCFTDCCQNRRFLLCGLMVYLQPRPISELLTSKQPPADVARDWVLTSTDLHRIVSWAPATSLALG